MIVYAEEHLLILLNNLCLLLKWVLYLYINAKINIRIYIASD